MEFYEREFLIARITCGYLLFKVNDNLILRINPLTNDQYYKAQIVFKESYDEALVQGIMCPIESREMLEEHGVWSEKEEKELESLEKECEKLKIEIYESYFKTAGREIARKLLRAKEMEHVKLAALKHSYDFTTAVGIATFSRWAWIIENTTTYENGKPYDWKDISVQDTLLLYKNRVISHESLREIAKTEPWRSIWVAGKVEGRIFDKASGELTVEQRGLIGWSLMYDSITESGESPPDSVIEDDDALDGWLLVQSQKRKQLKEKSTAEELMGKHPNAKDIFIKPESKDDIQRISDLNDINSQRIKQKRTQRIKEKGSVSYHKFDDVQQDLQNEIAASQD